MSRRLRLITSVLLLLQLLAAGAQAANPLAKGDTVVVPFQGEISPSLVTFLRRAVKAAETAEASAIVLDINTYGGRLDSAEEITNILNRAKVPTYSFVNSNA